MTKINEKDVQDLVIEILALSLSDKSFMAEKVGTRLEAQESLQMGTQIYSFEWIS